MIDTSALHASAAALYDYWRRIHPPAGLPGRQHFDPAAVTQLLPNIVLVEVQHAPLRFRYRLLGSRIEAISGRNLSGQRLDVVFSNHPRLAQLIDEYAHAATTRMPSWRRSTPVVTPHPDCRTVEVLRLPLATDGSTVDMILGMTLYFDAAGLPVETMGDRPMASRSAESARLSGQPRKDAP